MQTIINTNNKYAVNPKKFALWAGIGSICMFFIGITSALIVKKAADEADGNWQHFNIPTQFYISTVLIIISSVTLYVSKIFFNKGDSQGYKYALLLTVIFGSLFLVYQYLGWKALVSAGIFVGGETANPSGSFFYVISGAHAAHILGGLFPLMYITFKAFYKDMIFQKRNTIEMMSIYWHFVDVLWLYLFALLLF
jgi:cytochrome c oxidase subunit 3